MDSGFFVYAGGFTQAVIDGLVGPVSGRMIDMLNAFAVSGLALYIILFGMSVIFGLVQSPGIAGIIKMLTISFIFGIALSAANYGTFVLSTFNDFQDGLVSVIVGEDSDVYTLLDTSFGKGMELVLKCIDKAENSSWLGGGWIGWWLSAGFIIVGTFLVVLVGGCGILAAKIALALMFSVGPLFIFALAFPWTAKFFTSWFSQAMNYTLVIVLISLVITLSVVGFDGFIEGADLSGDGDTNPIIAALQIFGFSCLLTFITYQAYGMAASLSGGLSMGAMSLAHIVGAASHLGKLAGPRSTRMDASTGRPISGRLLKHVGQGNTIAGGKYRRRMYRETFRNYRSSGGSVQNKSK